MSVLLRRAEANDAEALAVFAARTFPLGGRPGADRADIAAHVAKELTPQKMRTMIGDANAVVVLAEEDSQIVGYGVLMLASSHPKIAVERAAEVYKFYVDPEHHGRGVANLLMRELLDASDCDTLWLSVFSENPRGIGFYRRWGFEVVGEQIYVVGNDRQQDLLMRRERNELK
ncbi:MAG TPA: GNAT family N-acetyltransferase [Candidatus Koribacter sp.]|jgi:ribosomal protein S18 acetylase RimI-like enzyme